jgi:DNA-binding NtrC family response regulator
MAKNEKLIFIIDDDEMMAQMLSDRLSENPLHQVKVFGTGEECIKNLGLKPDVVILDYHLNMVDPDAADGLEILQKIKGFNKNIYVIMLSSQKQYGKAAKTIMEGALEYVVKDEKSFERIESIIDAL